MLANFFSALHPIRSLNTFYRTSDDWLSMIQLTASWGFQMIQFQIQRINAEVASVTQPLKSIILDADLSGMQLTVWYERRNYTGLVMGTSINDSLQEILISLFSCLQQ